MKDFFSYIIIIAMIALIVFICYMIWKNNTGTQPEQPRGKKGGGGGTDIPGGAGDTVIPTEWSVMQVDPVSEKPIKTMNLTIPSSGQFTIGRENDCDFVLSGVTGKDGASRHHLGVGKDAIGYFAKPLPRENGTPATTYIEDRQITDSFSLVDRQVIWLGNVPIVFVRNANRRRNFNVRFDETAGKRDTRPLERDGRAAGTNPGRNAYPGKDNGVFRR